MMTAPDQERLQYKNPQINESHCYYTTEQMQH